MKDHQPNFDKLSIITAMVLLAYAFTAFIQIPEQVVSLQLPGFLLEFTIRFNTFVSLLVAVLAVSGSEWLLASHPRFSRRNRYVHWLLPGLTAIVIGVPLGTMQTGPTWWILFGFGGILFSAVLASEYISLDPADQRYSLAVIGLTAVAMALLLILMIALRGSGLRLFLVLAAILPSTALISARCISLRFNGRWNLPWAAVTTLITTQLAIGLYYLPISPLQFGLILIAAVYGLISVLSAIEEAQLHARVWVEPVIMSTLLVVLAVILG